MKRSDEKTSETIDAATGLPEDTPPEKRVDLSNLRDVRLEMAAVYREVKAGELESQDGSRRVYMLRQIADVIVNSDLEKRLQELEDRAGGRAPQGHPALPDRTLN